MHGKISRRAFGLAVSSLALGAGGCGSRFYDVTGNVTYNGAVLAKPDGQIIFVGPKGEQVPAEIALDGTFRATGVAAGANKVAVYYVNPKAKKDKAGPKLKPGEQPPTPPPPYLTPDKYATPDSSGLTVTVESGTVFNAELTGPAIREEKK